MNLKGISIAYEIKFFKGSDNLEDPFKQMAKSSRNFYMDGVHFS